MPAGTGQNERYDVIVIGGGPAGLSAAVWCNELGLRTILLEKKNEFGGQLLRIYNPITNYIGLETANGREMRDAFLKTTEHFNFERVTNCGVASIDTAERTVMTDDRRHLSANAIIVATGVRRRKLGVPGEERFRGKGIIESGSKDKESLSGKRVAIVGGGDAAIENSIILSGYASEIHIIHRRAEFKARNDFLEKVFTLPKIRFHTESVAKELLGAEYLSAISIENTRTAEISQVAVDNLLIRIGVEPNSELLKDKVAFDPAGYVIVDNNCSTNIPGIYAAGDIANPTAPTISSGAGMGATAAKAIFV